MKSLKLLGIALTSIIACSTSFAQELLPEVKVVAVNYKYLKSVLDSNAAEPVKMLQRQAAAYDVKHSEYYEDDYETYFITFFIPQGKILAAYDSDGKLLHTAEKFKEMQLPAPVKDAVKNKFPNWKISKNVYLVNYFPKNESARKVYKLLLENGDERMKVQLNEKGEVIN